MSEIAPIYHVSTAKAPPLATVPPRIDPAFRAMLETARRALLMAAAGIEVYLKVIDETGK